MDKKDPAVWRTISIGGVSPLRLYADLLKREIRVPEFGLTMLDSASFRITPTNTEIDLVVIDVRHEEGTKLLEVYRRVMEEFNVELCPAEVGPHLRLQFLDQPEGNLCYDTTVHALSVAMEPIPIIHEGKTLNCVFRVERQRGTFSHDGWQTSRYIWDDKSLSAYAPDESHGGLVPDEFWGRYVFVRPRTKQSKTP